MIDFSSPDVLPLSGVCKSTKLARYCYNSGGDCDNCELKVLGWRWRGSKAYGEAVYTKACQVPRAVAVLFLNRQPEKPEGEPVKAKCGGIKNADRSGLRLCLEKAKAHGLPVKLIASTAGVSRQSVRNWASGIQSPSMARVSHLCKVFGLKPGDLFVKPDTVKEQTR